MTSSAEVDLVSSVNIHVDKATGRKYSINAETGALEWLGEAVEEAVEAVHVDPASGRRYNSRDGCKIVLSEKNEKKNTGTRVNKKNKKNKKRRIQTNTQFNRFKSTVPG